MSLWNEPYAADLGHVGLISQPVYAIAALFC